MKKTTKLNIIMYSILILAAIGIILIEKLIINESLQLWLVIIIIFAVCIPTGIIRGTINRIRKEDAELDKQKRRLNVINKLEQLKDINDGYYTMYMLITNQCIELKGLMTKASLEIDYDYFEEDNILEVSIDSTSFRSHLFYSTSIFTQDNSLYLALSEQGKEVELTNQSYTEIVELITADINDYYKTLNTNSFASKLERKAKNKR